MQESLNLNPSREQWEHEFLTRIPPQEPIPPHILEELWKDSGAAGRKPAPKKDAARAEQSELFVGGGGTSTGETRRGLKWMNGIFMVLYGYGFGANIFDGNISRKSTGFVFAIVSSGSILVAASLFGFLAARNPTHMTRRKLAKWSNVLVVVLALFTLLRSLIIGGTTHGQTGYVGSTILYGFILGAFLALPALINLRAFWKLTSTVELPTKLDNEAQSFEPPNQEQAGLVAEYPVTEQTESDNNSPEEPPIANEQNEQHTEAVKEDSQATAPAKSSNYIVRHWRGDLSLGISYWANGVLVSFLILLASNMLDVLDAMHDSISLQLVFTLSLLVFATAIVASV